VFLEVAVGQLVYGRRVALGLLLAERVDAAVDVLPQPLGFPSSRCYFQAG